MGAGTLFDYLAAAREVTRQAATLEPAVAEVIEPAAFEAQTDVPAAATYLEMDVESDH